MRQIIKQITKLALLAIAAMLPQMASAHDFEVDGIYYIINGNNATVTCRGDYSSQYSNEYAGAVNIPSTVTYNGTTYSVTSIGYGAFSYCSGLTSVTIPNSVTEIVTEAFAYCSGLTSMVVESGNPKYDSRNICNAIIETATNTLICACKNTIIPNSVTKIGYWAFYGCTGLTSVTIPNSVTEIDTGAFAYCTGLTSVTIPNSVVEIDGSAFQNCSGLTSVTIGNSVKTIGEGAFSYCSGLTSVTIPNSVTSIGYGAFSFCSSLTSLSLDRFASISDDAFEGCNIEYLYVDGLALYSIVQSCLFKDTLKKLVIGDSMDAINTDFRAYSNLISIIIGNRVKRIQYGTFYGLSNLESVTIGNSVTTIQDNAFSDCENLNSLTIPSSVTFMSPYAFRGCLISNLTITGHGSFDIGRPIGQCFGYSSDDWGLDTLRVGSEITTLGGLQISPSNVYCYSNLPPECNSNTFTNYYGFLHVPSSFAASYFMADYWQNFNNFNYDIFESVTLDKTEVSLIQWDVLELIATATPVDSELQWFSTNPDVATVDDNGIVTATGGGECDIYVRFASNMAIYKSCHIMVNYPEITLSLSDESLEMNLGEEHTLAAIITPENTALTPTWSSSNTSVAIVDVNGKVTAIGEGECDITATLLDKTATCHVIVSGNVILTLNMDNAIMGASQMLTVYPSCSPDVPVELVVTSSDPSVAMARVVNRTNAPAAGLKSFPEKGMALAMMEELSAPSESKAPELASTKAIMIVGVQNGTATITVTTADGKATPAVLELRVVDVDGDRTITATDITWLYNYLLIGDETHIATSDINGDNSITSTDITVLYNILLGTN